MKKIKDYKLFLESKQTKEEIDQICQKYYITNYTINEDGTVDVDGDVNLFNLITDSDGKLNGRMPINFGKVTGYFDCGLNKLTTLEGSPKWVGKYFLCNMNMLKTLEGGPIVMIGGCNCESNNIINFKGFPDDFDGDLSINGNPVYKLLEKIPYEKWNKFIYWCNELNVIDDEGNVNVEWMEEVYHKLGLKYED